MMSRFTAPIVVIDFETTGMSPDMGERVTEVAALRVADGKITERFVSLINCNKWISPFITDLTGITQAMVDNAPPAAQIIPQLLDFIGSDTLLAHNASFDEKFLRAEAQRVQMQARHQGLLCSVMLARRLFPGHTSYSLGKISAALGIRFQSNAHRAEADAEVTAKLLLKMAQQLHQAYGLATIEPALLQKLMRLSAAKVPAFLHKQQALQTTTH